MPRIGHKDGCQCVVCKAMRAKELREVPQAPSVVPPITEEVLLGTLKPGDKFKYQVNRWAPVRIYIKYGTSKGVVAVEEVASSDVLRLNEDTLVLKV